MLSQLRLIKGNNEMYIIRKTSPQHQSPATGAEAHYMCCI
jgi:hypothetical protein